jgi:hypothetical protein
MSIDSIYKFKGDLGTITPYIEELEINCKYLLNNSTTNNYNELERFIFESIKFNNSSKNETLFTNYFIEFYCFNDESNKLSIEYDKNEKNYPLTSIVTILYDNSSPFITTNIDVESYKYKEFPEESTIPIFITEKNIIFSFNSSFFHGIINTKTNKKYLKINVWDKEPKHVNYYINNSTVSNNDFEFETVIDYPVLRECLIKTNIFESILYNNNFDDFSSILSKYDIQTFTKIDINIGSLSNYSKLLDKHGDSFKDFLPFYTDSKIDENNRFYRNKLYNNILSRDVCYWIINEVEKQKWISKKYKNYGEYVNLDNVPSVLSFILYSLTFWISQFKKDYNFDKIDIHTDVSDIFVTKIDNKSVIKSNIDDSFLTVILQLNDKLDFTNGDIVFENNEIIKMNQCDMFVHNGKSLKCCEKTDDGIKYLLVIMINIKK